MVIGIVIMIIVGFFRKGNKDPPKIFGVYAQPGQWYTIKYYLFLLILYVRNFLSQLKKTDSGLGANTQEDVRDLDRSKPLSSKAKAFDAVFFQGVCNESGYYLCAGIEKRHMGYVNGVCYLMVPGMGLLRGSTSPKTQMLNAAPNSETEYAGGGIRFTMVEPMTRWRIAYKGKMLDASDKLVNVDLDAEWTAHNYPHFMFEAEMDKRLIAEAVAREPWSRAMFKNLRDAHQTHYEQMGYLKGTLVINGDSHKLDMKSFRDHSFGEQRDWSLMHRYAFHVLHLNDNTRIVVGVVSQPCTTSHMEMGYIVTPRKEVHPIRSCDLRLYQHGEKGRPGQDIAFTFMANKCRYDVATKTVAEGVHYKGSDVEARFLERFITCDVNGVKGRGIAEWHYNNLDTESL